jgi:amidase
VDALDLAFAGVVRQAELVRAGEVSSRELVELYLERIERIDPELNSYRKVMGERALADAAQADARRAGGDERPLLGVPVAVKDAQDVAGEVTSWGTAANLTPAAQDSELVRRCVPRARWSSARRTCRSWRSWARPRARRSA